MVLQAHQLHPVYTLLILLPAFFFHPYILYKNNMATQQTTIVSVPVTLAKPEVLVLNADDGHFPYPTSMEALKDLMLAGEQSPGINYYMHGEQVADCFEALMLLAKDNRAMLEAPHWNLPKWFVDHQQWIYQQLQPKFDVYRKYHVWHDCGKPLVKQLDMQQQAHYPDHAAISAKAYLKAGGDAYIANLIDQDMVCHHLRTVEETKLLSHTNADMLILMVTAVCAMHVCTPSVAEGDTCPVDLTQTTGFKIKLKRIAYNGKIMMRILLHPASNLSASNTLCPENNK